MTPLHQHTPSSFTPPPPLLSRSKTFSIQLLNTHNASKYRHDYIALLGQLTNAPELNENVFLNLLQTLWHQNTQIFLVLEESEGKVKSLVGAASLLVEQKIVHGGAKVGHVEDVVVNDKYRGFGLGKFAIEACTQYASKIGCYKVILDCSEENVSFYEKCGFKRKEIQMRMDLPTIKARL